MLIPFHILGLLILVAVGAWLSRFDTGLQEGETRRNFWRRFIRVAVTVALVEIMAGMTPMIRPFMLIFIAVVWASCGAELGARLLRHFVDPTLHDHRPIHLNAHEHYADEIARLIHSGQREAAFELCERLKVSGEIPHHHLEDIQAYLGMDPRLAGSLTDAVQLRANGRPTEAVAWLNTLLRRQPRHAQAIILLMRIYVKDLRQPDRAAAALRQWETQPGLEPAQVEFARGLLTELVPATVHPAAVESMPPAPLVPPPTPPALTVEELITQGQYGTVIERLERELAKTPDNLSGWLQLAEVYACHCGNLTRAEKIVRQIHGTPTYTAEQRELATLRLKEWRRRG